MPIICPHCTTSYGVDPATLGAAGRSVRCARCKQVWLAKPEDATAPRVEAAAMAMAAAPAESLPPDDPTASHHLSAADTPMIESPSIAAGLPEGGATAIRHDDVAWSESDADAEPVSPAPRRAAPEMKSRQRRSFALPRPLRAFVSLPSACTAMAALLLALVLWRADVVRQLPQTASLYRLIGLDVNLRGLAIKDVKIASETVDGKPVLVIEGLIIDVARKPVELPRLRFVVRDGHGTEIYGWNAVLEQSVLQPGEKAWFRSRLASPPADAHSIDVRFFNRRDLSAGRA